MYKNTIIKIFSTALIFVSVMVTLALPTAASPIDNATSNSDSLVCSTQTKETIGLRREQVGWYYMKKNGVEYKRLWSFTYGEWLTDWVKA